MKIDLKSLTSDELSALMKNSLIEEQISILKEQIRRARKSIKDAGDEVSKNIKRLRKERGV